MVDYQIERLGLDAGGGMPPFVKTPEGEKILYTDGKDIPDGAELTGEVEWEHHKVKKFYATVEEKNCNSDEVAVIEDSIWDLYSLLVPVKIGGGIAVGFNIREKDRPKFEEAGIPVIKENNLEGFKEIVLNPKSIRKYCV